jgi:hypothetical protein
MRRRPQRVRHRTFPTSHRHGHGTMARRRICRSRRRRFSKFREGFVGCPTLDMRRPEKDGATWKHDGRSRPNDVTVNTASGTCQTLQRPGRPAPASPWPAAASRSLQVAPPSDRGRELSEVVFPAFLRCSGPSPAGHFPPSQTPRRMLGPRPPRRGSRIPVDRSSHLQSPAPCPSRLLSPLV